MKKAENIRPTERKVYLLERAVGLSAFQTLLRVLEWPN